MTGRIEGWLEKAGFGRYADAFIKNDVGLDILSQLTEIYLKELGVSLGDRLRLAKIIAAEATGPSHGNSDPAVQPVSKSPLSEENPQAPTPQNDAERRPLTVMFCDLADSTTLSTMLDPEDLQDVIRAYQDASADCVKNYEGYIAKYMGDGILVYFGYPKSLERNGERALHTALDIVDAMAGLNRTLGNEKGIEISVRVGIASGTVMVGEVVGEGLARERTVIGEAPNMAARLQGLAPRNGIVVGSLTKEIAGDVFVYKDMGVHKLKGISEPSQTWIVTGLSDDDGKPKADDLEVITRQTLVGRDEEIGLLNRAWQSTKGEGRGQVVTLSGEAGIGKSSLIDGLKAQVRGEGWPQLTLRCSPYHTNSALYPVIEHFKRLARWKPEDNEVVRLDKIERMLDLYAQPNAEVVPLMAALLAVPVPEDRYPPLFLSPPQQKQLTQDMIVGITLEVAERGAFLELWEDLHWADPSTQELIGLLIEQTPTAGLLMILTARPDFTPPWPMRSHITPITLNRLERPHAEALINSLAGDKPLPNEVVDHIAAKTDGVPLFVEELTKTILTSDILIDTGSAYELTGPLTSLSIPDTLQESLMARLDRLPQVRELAQLGSVLGREFAYEMISELSAVGDEALQKGLGQLVDAELLYQRGRPPRARYIFKHALVQDAAYGSLLRRNRQSFHQQVAKLIEARFPDLAQNEPELIAHHLSEADLDERAIDYFLKAGERALLSSANEEAIVHLDRGLEIIGRMPDASDWRRQELNMVLMSAPALVAARGYAAPEVEPAYSRALELCRSLGETEREFEVLLGQSMFHFLRAEIPLAQMLAEQAVELAETSGQPGFDLAAQRQLGLVTCLRGELNFSVACFDKVSDAYKIDIHGAFAFRRGGSDFGVGAMSTSGFALSAMGLPDQARDRCIEGLDLAQKLDHPISIAYANWVLAFVYRDRGEFELALEHAGASISIAEENGFPQYVAWITGLRGGICLDQGNVTEAIAELRKGIDANVEIGSRLFRPYWDTSLADDLGRNNQAEEGLEVIATALDEVAHTQERFRKAEIYRVKGNLFLVGGEADQSKAAVCFGKAIDIAQSQNAKLWELRAATDLARLRRRQGRADDARNILEPVHTWFTEGFETASVKDANSLLDELA